MKSYFVYKISFDSDFESCPQIYLLGLYKEKSKAEEICTKDICKILFIGKLIQTKNALCSYYK